MFHSVLVFTSSSVGVFSICTASGRFAGESRVRAGGAGGLALQQKPRMVLYQSTKLVTLSPGVNCGPDVILLTN